MLNHCVHIAGNNACFLIQALRYDKLNLIINRKTDSFYAIKIYEF
jgi:hypothetical protein